MRYARPMKIAVFLLLLILLTGCGYKDIDKRLFAVTIGVDVPKDHAKKYLVSIKFAIPSNSKENPSEFLIVSEKADSMSEAVRIIKTKVDKEVDFSHAKVIVLSEEVVKKKGNAGMYYWFTRRRDIQQIAWVTIAKSSAVDVLKAKPKSEQLPSNALFLALGKEGSETPYIISEFLFDFKKRLIEKGLDPFLPIIEPKKDILEINSVGIFNKSQLKLIITEEETKYLNFMLNREQKGALWARREKTKFTVDTEKVKTKYKIHTQKGKQGNIKVYVTVKGKMEEASRRIPPGRLSLYEKAAEKQVNKDLKALLERFQKAGLDPIGFGLRYRARHFNKNDWEEWENMYPGVKFQVTSKVKITDTGLIE